MAANGVFFSWYLPAEARIRVAFKGPMPIASMLTLSDGKTMIDKYGASDAAHHNSGGVQFLLWKTIQDACRTIGAARAMSPVYG